MIGKQFSFFLDHCDQDHFESALRSSGDLVFLKEISANESPVILQSSRIVSMGSDLLGILIARNSDIDEIRFREFEKTGFYMCDHVNDNVIEFTRSFVTDKFIRPGRLYVVVDKYLEDGSRIRKSEDFLNWVGVIFRLAKKSLIRLEDGFYAGRGALQLRKSGLLFENFDVGYGAIRDAKPMSG